MLHLCILGSTRGTNLQAIVDAKIEGVRIEFVLSNKEDAFILERASRLNLKAIFLDPKGKKRENYDREITKLLEDYNIDLVLLIGWMKILSSEFVDRWNGKVVNIHGSLLPAFSGKMDLEIHRAVLDRGCKVSGATLMYINSGIDTGPIISQKAVEVKSGDTPETLKARVQRAEQELLIDYLREKAKHSVVFT